MIAYKIFKKSKSGLFKPAQVPVARLQHKGYEVGVWYPAENAQPTNLKERIGFHCVNQPSVPHIKIIPNKIVWVEVEIEDYTEIRRPQSQGGLWYLANHLKIIRELSEEERINMISKEQYDREMR